MEEHAHTDHENSKHAAKMVAGVQFRPAGKIYTFVTEEADFKRGEAVVVEAEGGSAVGFVIVPPHEGEEGEIAQNAKKIIRKAEKEDLISLAVSREKALECFAFCRDKIREKSLPMKLVDAVVEEDGKKIVFTFFAEQRIDFRGLVKELAGMLHMRIEMRQVGSRDESKHKGCLGPCGLTTCCSLYLRQFEPISISMAKHQGLAPNPAKLTGMCNKLKCCLSYEHEAYDECRKGLPKIGAAVSSKHGSGKIIGHNVLKRECAVRLYSGGEFRCPCDELSMLTAAEKQAAIDAVRKAEEAGEERQRRFGRSPVGRDGKRKGNRNKNNNVRSPDKKQR